MTSTHYVDATSRLRKDLAAFSDPGSMIEVEFVSDASVVAHWLEDGADRRETFRLDTIEPLSVLGSDGGAQSYKSFLAGPAMGNLRALARNTLRVIEPLKNFVPPRGRAEGAHSPEGAALDILLSAASPGTDSTSVVFIAADAGVGKTVLLKEAVRHQAERYLKGEASTFWLYVDAQARRLAALDEALASELDRLRAKFSFDAASPLVRTGALTLVVDGFDELIGSVGAYDEAFNSLADFIAGLDGAGSIVAAARSTYYEQEFLARVNRGLGQGDRWTLYPIRLRPWSSSERASFITAEAKDDGRNAKESAAVLEQVETALSTGELQGVSGKPFFVARTTELVLTNSLPDDLNVGLLGKLVEAYIERDVGKLLSAARVPLLDKFGLRAFFDELAIEMWRQESRELSRTSVRELATLVGEAEQVDEDGIREILTRAPYFAMLHEGSTPGSVTWEHDVYFAYFLSAPIAEVVSQGNPRLLARLLRRGRLPEDGALLTGKLLAEADLQVLLDLLASAVDSESVEIERVRRNAGMLAGGRFSDAVTSDVQLRDLLVGDIPLGSASFTNCSFVNISWSGTDLSNAKFFSCTASGRSTFNRVVISPGQTHLDIEGVAATNFAGLTIRREGSEEVAFSPKVIQEALVACGLSNEVSIQQRPVREDVAQLVDRVVRVYSRSNVIIEAPDNDMTNITGDRNWPIVRRALLESNVAVAELKSASGQKVFLRRTVRSELIDQGFDSNSVVPNSVRTFWDLLETP